MKPFYGCIYANKTQSLPFVDITAIYHQVVFTFSLAKRFNTVRVLVSTKFHLICDHQPVCQAWDLFWHLRTKLAIFQSFQTHNLVIFEVRTTLVRENTYRSFQVGFLAVGIPSFCANHNETSMYQSHVFRINKFCGLFTLNANIRNTTAVPREVIII